MGEQTLHEIDNLRAEKDSFFGTDHDSPIPARREVQVQRSEVFPPSIQYRVNARLGRFDGPDLVMMTTSKGTTRPYLRYGKFEFQLEGRKLQLHCYKAADDALDKSLFVPFTDETSGKETYGAGRYLDIEETGRDDYVLDFNLAYNPYCAYSENYVCPFPPRENRLTVQIQAGEKNYK